MSRVAGRSGSARPSELWELQPHAPRARKPDALVVAGDEPDRPPALLGVGGGALLAASPVRAAQLAEARPAAALGQAILALCQRLLLLLAEGAGRRRARHAPLNQCTFDLDALVLRRDEAGHHAALRGVLPGALSAARGPGPAPLAETCFAHAIVPTALTDLRVAAWCGAYPRYFLGLLSRASHLGRLGPRALRAHAEHRVLLPAGRPQGQVHGRQRRGFPGPEVALAAPAVGPRVVRALVAAEAMLAQVLRAGVAAPALQVPPRPADPRARPRVRRAAVAGQRELLRDGRQRPRVVDVEAAQADRYPDRDTLHRPVVGGQSDAELQRARGAAPWGSGALGGELRRVVPVEG
eukprot:CAMPEP_0179373308 /NCGR_PEP_ID=MMETSP0797-20121207/86733_1 /TAXON_ID=47934 /ORGANISM="Dinophysis acuminata, Strain DAEP01" /LENGTH=351 /DNA_ID=CAMNT_0021089305 /DNA_START=59 /DNA_END=1111 /DNA_ORIENTATION=-